MVGLSDENCEQCVHKKVCILHKAVWEVEQEQFKRLGSEAYFLSWTSNIGSVCKLRKERR